MCTRRFLVLLVAFAGLCGIARAQAKPQDGGAEPRTVTPSVASQDDEGMRFAKAADYSAQLSGRALLIQREGSVIFERYDNGWAAGRPHPLASGTKSFTGVMAMMAAGLGKQRLYVIPQYQLVVVRFAEATAQGQRFDDRELLGRILGSIN